LDQFGDECCHLVGDILDNLQKCFSVGQWRKARERRLGFSLNNEFWAAGCGVEFALGLTGKDGP
jgi:hypothetical protein